MEHDKLEQELIEAEYQAQLEIAEAEAEAEARIYLAQKQLELKKLQTTEKLEKIRFKIAKKRRAEEIRELKLESIRKRAELKKRQKEQRRELRIKTERFRERKLDTQSRLDKLTQRLEKLIGKRRRIIDGPPPIRPPPPPPPPPPTIWQQVKGNREVHEQRFAPGSIISSLQETIQETIRLGNTSREFQIQFGDSLDISTNGEPVYTDCASTSLLKVDTQNPLIAITNPEQLGSGLQVTYQNGIPYIFHNNENVLASQVNQTFFTIADVENSLQLTTSFVPGLNKYFYSGVSNTYQNTFRKFMTAIWDANQGSDLALLLDPSAHYSIGTLALLMEKFLVFYDYLHASVDRYMSAEVIAQMKPDSLDLTDTEEQIEPYEQFPDAEVRILLQHENGLGARSKHTKSNQLYSHDTIINGAKATISYFDPTPIDANAKPGYCFLDCLAYKYPEIASHFQDYFTQLIAHNNGFPTLQQCIDVCVHLKQTYNISIRIHTDLTSGDLLMTKTQVKLVKPTSPDWQPAMEAIHNSNCRIGDKIYGWNGNIQYPVVWEIIQPNELNLIMIQDHCYVLARAKRWIIECDLCEKKVPIDKCKKMNGCIICEPCKKLQQKSFAPQGTQFFAFADIEAVPITPPMPSEEEITTEINRIQTKFLDLCEVHQYLNQIKDRITPEVLRTQVINARRRKFQPTTINNLLIKGFKVREGQYNDKLSSVSYTTNEYGVKTQHINSTQNIQEAIKTIIDRVESENLSPNRKVIRSHQLFNETFECVPQKFEGDNCVQLYLDSLVELKLLGQNVTTWFHNGGRFDFHLILEKAFTNRHNYYLNRDSVILAGSTIISWKYADHQFFDFFKYHASSLDKLCEDFAIPKCYAKVKEFKDFIDPVTKVPRSITSSEWWEVQPEDGFHSIQEYEDWLTTCNVKQEMTQYEWNDVYSLGILCLATNDACRECLRQILQQLPELEPVHNVIIKKLSHGSMVKPTIGGFVMSISAAIEAALSAKNFAVHFLKLDKFDTKNGKPPGNVMTSDPRVTDQHRQAHQYFKQKYTQPWFYILEHTTTEEYVPTANGVSAKHKEETKLTNLIKKVLKSRTGGISLARSGYEGRNYCKDGFVLLDVKSLYPAALFGLSWLYRKHPEHPFTKHFIDMIGPKALQRGLYTREGTNEILNTEQVLECERILPMKRYFGFYTMDWIHDPLSQVKGERWMAVVPGKQGANLDWECPLKVSVEFYVRNGGSAKETKPNQPICIKDMTPGQDFLDLQSRLGNPKFSVLDEIVLDDITLDLLERFNSTFQYNPTAQHYIFKNTTNEHFSTHFLSTVYDLKSDQDQFRDDKDQRYNVSLRELYKMILNVPSGKMNQHPQNEKVLFSNHIKLSKLDDACDTIGGMQMHREVTYSESIDNVNGERIYSISKMIMFHYFNLVEWNFVRVETDSICCPSKYLSILEAQGYIGGLLGQLESEFKTVKITELQLLGPKAALFVLENGKTKAVFKGFPKHDLKISGERKVFEQILTQGFYRQDKVLNMKRTFIDELGPSISKSYSVKMFNYKKVLNEDGSTKIHHHE